MRLITVIAACLLVGLPTTEKVSAEVLTFDDANFSRGCYSCTDRLDDGYGGFIWDNGTDGFISTLLTDDSARNHPNWLTPNIGYINGTVSGDVVAFNDSAASPVQVDLDSTGTFNYVGSWFGSAYADQTISFTGYNNGQLLYSSNIYDIYQAGPTWIDLSWTGIDSLVITSTGNQWSMDNFTYTTAVPVPAAVWLFGSALIAVGLRCREN